MIHSFATPRYHICKLRLLKKQSAAKTVLQFFLNSDILNSEEHVEVDYANREIRHG